jgi:hypothetical protein
VPATLVAFSAQLKPPSVNSRQREGRSEVPCGCKHACCRGYLGREAPHPSVLRNRLFCGRKDARQQPPEVDQFNVETYQPILQHGMLLHMDLDPQPGKNQLRLAVEDNRAGRVATLEAPTPQ